MTFYSIECRGLYTFCGLVAIKYTWIAYFKILLNFLTSYYAIKTWKRKTCYIIYYTYIVMYSELYRADQSQTKYKPESSTQKGRVNPPPWEGRLTEPMVEKGRGKSNLGRIVLVVKSDKRRDCPYAKFRYFMQFEPLKWYK